VLNLTQSGEDPHLISRYSVFTAPRSHPIDVLQGGRHGRLSGRITRSRVVLSRRERRLNVVAQEIWLQARRREYVKFTRLKAAGVAAGVAAFAFIGTHASAHASAGVTSSDGSGVDFDAACLIGDPSAPPATPNNVPSPGANSACLVGTYDGSTESTDLNNVSLSTNGVDNVGPSDNQLVARWGLDAQLPPAGGACNPQVGGPGCPDLPDSSFVGLGFKALFQNATLNRQDNTPTNGAGGGCPRFPTGTVFDQHGHWLDGYHHFIGFDAVWDGAKWIHSAQVGTYDPSPDGAFFFTELGTNDGLVDSDGDGSTWDESDPAAQYGTNWSVTYGPGFQVSVAVDGVLGSSSPTCIGGVFNTVYFKDGDLIVNVKWLSTADSTVTLPVTIPLSLIPGFSDITSIGGFIFFSDITLGNSANTGIVGSALQPNRTGVSYTGGSLGISDTLGDSPACPTPTFGGTLPTNPFLNKFVGCQYDDDNIPVPDVGNPTGPWTAINPGERGTFLSEWWDTIHKFVA
jgi:hypothetical protein